MWNAYIILKILKAHIFHHSHTVLQLNLGGIAPSAACLRPENLNERSVAGELEGPASPPADNVASYKKKRTRTHHFTISC